MNYNNKKLATRFLLVHLGMLLCVGGALPQNQQPKSELSLFEKQKRAKAALIVRMKKPWSGNEQSFLAIERALDKELAAKNSQSLVAKYKEKALQKKTDAQGQFRWAYVAWRAASSIPVSADVNRGLRGVSEALWNAPSPRSYRYDRLIFLVETFNQSSPELRPLGERLVKRDPKDYAVLYKFIRMLDIGKEPTETQRALAYSQQLLQAEPRNPRYLSILGYVHYRNLLHTKRRVDSEKAIAA